MASLLVAGLIWLPLQLSHRHLSQELFQLSDRHAREIKQSDDLAESCCIDRVEFAQDCSEVIDRPFDMLMMRIMVIAALLATASKMRRVRSLIVKSSNTLFRAGKSKGLSVRAQDAALSFTPEAQGRNFCEYSLTFFYLVC